MRGPCQALPKRYSPLPGDEQLRRSYHQDLRERVFPVADAGTSVAGVAKVLQVSGLLCIEGARPAAADRGDHRSAAARPCAGEGGRVS